ncbi:Scaffold-type E3 ligase [Elasticomyces elasticus]|nr:Scaffold-type E3 ligase [Elasticomyces elasticus]KAK5009874.1 hypothetical protein LTR28_012963 [Elasticomyces elasticus]
MPPSYTPQQKAAIAQYVAITQADKNAAVRTLKQYSWNLDQAVNAFYTGGNNTAAASPHQQTLSKLFDKYKDPQSKEADKNDEVTNIEGTMKYFEDIGVGLEDVSFFIVSELLQSPSMGELTRRGFIDGWSSQGIDTLPKMKNHILARRSQLPDPAFRPTFKAIYKHAFPLARAQGQKVLALDFAVEYWKILLSPPSLAWSTPSTPFLDLWLDFVQTRYRRAVNKDMWEQTLRFAEMCLLDESMAWWNEEAAWPGVIDDFVEFVREKRAGEMRADEMDVE